MDGTYRGTHIEPFAKLKFGWLRPQLIVRSGQYSLPSIETERFVWILMNPPHSVDEYYIVEKRRRSISYDKQMPDVGGLAIWHIMEDPIVFGSVPPPPGVTPEQWELVSKSDGALCYNLQVLHYSYCLENCHLDRMCWYHHMIPLFIGGLPIPIGTGTVTVSMCLPL
jgi:hypothetical protein